MKNTFLIACAAALLSACSGPSYYMMSAKKSAYHGENYKVAAAPVAAQPDDAAPLEASSENTPAMLPPAYARQQTQNTAPVSAPVQQSQQAPISAPQAPAPVAEAAAPAASQQKQIKKAGPKKLLKQLTSNTRLALIFLIVGAIVALLLHFVVGILLVIVGIILLIA